MARRCVAPRCPDPAGESGLCARHEKRLLITGTLPTYLDPVKGDRSGEGHYGILDVDELGALCHECGLRFAGLGQHVVRSHGLKVDGYKQRHGLDGSLQVRSTTPRRRPHPCSRCGVVLITPAKICDACRAHRQEARIRRQMRFPRWRILTAEERTALAAANPDELPELVLRLQRGRVPSKAIGTVLDISPGRMSERFPRPDRRRPKTPLRSVTN